MNEQSKAVFFSQTADVESEKWDNRKNAPWRAREELAERAHAAFLVQHQEILQYLRGFY